MKFLFRSKSGREVPPLQQSLEDIQTSLADQQKQWAEQLAKDPAAETIIRELLERAVGRLRLLCANLLHGSYPRLTRPPTNLETDELLGSVVAATR